MIAYSKQDFCVTLFPNELNEDALYTAQARVLQQFHNKFVSELGAFVIVIYNSVARVRNQLARSRRPEANARWF